MKSEIAKLNHIINDNHAGTKSATRIQRSVIEAVNAPNGLACAETRDGEGKEETPQEGWKKNCRG
jgi:hypothetical protein